MASGAGAYKGTSGQDSAQFRAALASYSTANPFFMKILRHCSFEHMQTKREIRLLDAMAGPGKLGKDLKKVYSDAGFSVPLLVAFNDVRAEPLAGLDKEGYETVQCDIRKIGASGQKFDIIAIRFGLKDLPEGQAQIALASVRAALVPEGKLVIGDMTAYSPEGQRGVNLIHAAKQRYAGRDEEKEGICFIPQRLQWEEMLHQVFTGFVLVPGFTSIVDTSQWKGQFGPNADDGKIIAELNSLIRQASEANPTFAKEFNVRFEGEKVLIDFPLFVASTSGA